MSKKPDPTQPQSRMKRSCAALLLAFTAQAVQANPLGPSVVSGQAGFVASGSTLTVTNTPNTIINWQGFSIGSGEITRFVQQNAASAVLNRVTGGNPSSILGSLQSNGRVFLVNPNGILFGAGATVDVAGLVATSLNMSNADFLAGRYSFSQVPGAQSISNAGNITAQSGGQIYLIAPDVENTGIITAPNGEILLAAGHSVELVNSIEPNLRVNITAPAGDATNVGQLIAESGSLGLFGTMVKNSGTASADSATARGGKIVFKSSQRTEISGAVSADGVSGGTVQALGNQVGIMDGATVRADGAQGGGTLLVGGDYQGKNPGIPNAQVTYVASTATLSADATDNGNGGKVIVWADDTARVHGNISARGGANGGDGGFVETSGHRYLDVTRAPDLSAPSGRSGSWLLDPEDITISSAANSNITASSPFSPAAAGSSTLSDAVLRAALVVGATVTVDTTGGGGGTGNILVDATSNLANIDLSAGASTLYLKAHNDITVNSSITAINNPLTMYLIADQDSNSTGAVYINNALNSNNGSINISAGGNITLNVGTGTNIAAGTGTASLTSASGAIIGDMMGAPLDISAASVMLNAATGISAGGGQFYVNAGSISFNNTGSQYVRIYNNHVGASSFTGSTGGGLGLESYDSANPTSVGNITAGGDIAMRINNPNINGPVAAGANTVYLAPFTFNSPVSIHGGATFDLSGAEISNISAGKIVVGYDSYGNYASAAQVGTGSAVNITNAANLEVWANTLSTGNTVSNAGGKITLASDAMTLAGAISAGEVWLKGKSYSQNIDLGGADVGGTLGLTSAELDTITASVLRIGNIGAGAINVSANIAPAGTSTFSLYAGGPITQTGTIIATNLAIQSSSGSVTLGYAGNNVANLAASVNGSNNEHFIFNDSGGLTIGTVDGISGINIANHANFAPGVSYGVISLQTSDGDIMQSSTGLLSGAAVKAVASGAWGSVILNTGGGNPTGVIAGYATGDFSYTSSNGIAVSDVYALNGISAGGNLFLTSLSNGVIANAPISAAYLSVTAGSGNGIMLTNTANAIPSVMIVSGGNVSLTTSAGIELVGPSNISGTLTVNALNGNISQAGSLISVSGAATLTAPSASYISLFNTDFSTLNASAGQIIFTDANSITLGIISAATSIGVSAGGNVVVNGPITSAGSVSISAEPVSGTILGGGLITAPSLNLQAGGNIGTSVAYLQTATDSLTGGSIYGSIYIVNASTPTSNTLTAPNGAVSVLPTLSQCIAAPMLAGCTSVLPSLSTCTSAPATAGCSVVLPSFSTCTAAPATAGCEVVLPSLATCVASPATAGCGVVLPPPPPTTNQCIADPALAGCTAALSTVVQNTVTNVATTLTASTVALPVAPLTTPPLTQTVATAPADAPTADSGGSGEEDDKKTVIVPDASASTAAPQAAAPLPVCN